MWTPQLPNSQATGQAEAARVQVTSQGRALKRGDSLEGEEPSDLLAPPSLLGVNKLQIKAPVFLKHKLGGEEIFETTEHRSHKR